MAEKMEAERVDLTVGSKVAEMEEMMADEMEAKMD